MKKYCQETLGVTHLRHIIHYTRRELRTADRWLSLILKKTPPRIPFSRKRKQKWTGHQALFASQEWGDNTGADMNVDTANDIHNLFKQIPRDIIDNLVQLLDPIEPEIGEYRFLRGGLYGQYQGDETYKIFVRNTVGKLVDTGEEDTYAHRDSSPVAWWQVDKRDYFGKGKIELRALGALHSTFPNPEGWKLDGEVVDFDLLSIRLRTRALAIRKMEPPPAPEAWADPKRLPHVKLPWEQIWRLRSFFATPRDMITWLKAIHRNLYLHGAEDEDDRCKKCTAHKESILHLVQCADIRREFWDPLARVIAAMGLTIPDDPTERQYFWLFGRLSEEETVGDITSGIIFIAWRCLYAELVHSKVDKVPISLKAAVLRVWQMVITRLKAEGFKWRQWNLINENTGNKSRIPEEHQNKIVINCDRFGEYHINPLIFKAHAEALEAHKKEKDTRKRFIPNTKPQTTAQPSSSSDSTPPVTTQPGSASDPIILTNPTLPTARPPKRTWADFAQATGFRIAIPTHTSQEQQDEPQPTPEPEKRPRTGTWAEFAQATGFQLTAATPADLEQSSEEQYGPDYMGEDQLEWLDL